MVDSLNNVCFLIRWHFSTGFLLWACWYLASSRHDMFSLLNFQSQPDALLEEETIDKEQQKSFKGAGRVRNNDRAIKWITF